MIVLGIDTSSTDLSVCVGVDGFPLATVNRYARNSHAEHITLAVKLALELGGVDAKDVGRVAISVGPGSFTGLRIGLSFVKGFCLMTERRVLPLSSLLVLAHAAVFSQPANGFDRRSGKIFTALDARQGRVHWGGFAFGDDGGNISHNGSGGGVVDDGNIGNNDSIGNNDNIGGTIGNVTNNIGNNIGNKTALRRLTGDRLSPPEELMDALSPDDFLVADAMGYPRSAVFDMFDGKARVIRAERAALSRGASCAALAFGGAGDESLWLPAREIVPNYLQMSAAEEKRAVCN